jgi:hypothetical protein
VLEDEREIKLGGEQLPEGGFAVDERVADVEQRMVCLGVRGEFGREHGEGREEHADAHVAGLEAGECGDLGLGELEPAEDGVGVPYQHRAGLGREDSLACAVDELRAQPRLEHGYLAGDCGLRE